MSRYFVLILLSAFITGISLDYTHAVKGNRVTIDDDCSCSDRDRRHRLFTSIDDSDCTNTSQSNPTVWIQLRQAPSDTDFHIEVIHTDSDNSIDIFPDFISCGDNLYYFQLDTGFVSDLSHFNGNGRYLVGIYDELFFSGFIGSARYVVDIP
ncbi:MAG TPA: hypothetical protein VLB82_09560 [Thermodesulfobacteriota bacterium]|nr:hypothetical protein [Thermodesulfobacteriota bacterium]